MINAKPKTYLTGQVKQRARRFYLLPKVHKEPGKWEPGKWSRPHEIPPGRTFVSDRRAYETYFTTEYLDHYLNPLQKASSYGKDTYDFTGKIRQLTIPPDSLLFMDIDISEGIQAVRNIFSKYPDSNPEKELLALKHQSDPQSF